MDYKKIIKRLQLINIVLVALLVLIVGCSLAIYTSQVYQRAVVRNRYNDVIRFSSDKLYRVNDTSSPEKYYYPLGENQTSVTFTVCNYDQTKSTLYNENDLKYDISFSIKNGTDNGFEYVVTKGNIQKGIIKNGGGLTLHDNSLDGGHRSVDTYSISFHGDDYNKVEITVIVTPADDATTQNRKLNGILIPIKYSTTQGMRIEWSYPDSVRGTPHDFDAYNLMVSVSGGQGDVLISWDSIQLDIDPYFAAGKAVATSGSTKTITVNMNSEDETGTYLITFYNHNSTKPKWQYWKQTNEVDNSFIPITVRLAESTSAASGE